MIPFDSSKFCVYLASFILVFSSTNSFAIENNSGDTGDGNTIVSALKTPVNFTNSMSTEVGFTLSSINRGSTLTSVALNREFGSWFTGGIRALLPAQFSNETQTYAAQIYGRFPILNNENVIYFEPQISQGIFSDKNDMKPFAFLGLAYGYTRRFAGNFNAGINVGIDYSTARVTDEGLLNSSGVFSRMGLTGGYYF
jgi:hypothetical protein